MKKLSKKEFWIGFLITFFLTLALSGLITLLNQSGNQMSWDTQKFVILSDGFSIAGLLGIMVYILTFLSQKGAFDILSYSIQVVWTNTFHKNLRETNVPKNYAEYKEIKRGKLQENFIYILLGSLPTFLIGILFLILHYMIER